MSMRGSWLLLLIFAFTGLGFACGKKEEVARPEQKSLEVKGSDYNNSLPGEEGMKNAVRGYVQAVIDANLSDRHFQFLEKYATEKEAKRVFIFIKPDRERNLAMYMRVNKLSFDNISSSESTNFVDTSEHWDFQYLAIKTSKPTDPVRSIRYKLRYHLIRDGDRWMVSKLEEREKSKTGEYIPPRWKM